MAKKRMANVSKYAKRKAAARLYIAEQIHVKAYPLTTLEETVRTMSDLRDRELTRRETQTALRSTNKYTRKYPRRLRTQLWGARAGLI